MYNFFERQAQSRSATRRLVLLLAVSVAAVVLAVNLAVFLATSGNLMVSRPTGAGGNNLVADYFRFLSSPPGLWISAITVAVIAGGSIVRMVQLAGSADKVATMMGGRRVNPQDTSALEKRLVNVVEEMAIAAGMKVPRIYVMYHEPGINAFAAGLNTNDAVIAVTRGALESLTREELQGVVAHEFSHILNSDMRLNTQLIGLLAGILLIGKIGQHLMESSSSSYSNRKNNAGLLGLLLVVIGAVGLFFGQLIKAAISRQREFLADASAVQFTRLPEGIGMALMKIRKSVFNSALVSPQAEEVSHMCFGAGKRPLLKSMLATHPPLEERIKAIDPMLLKREVVLSPAFDSSGDPDQPPGYTPVTPLGMEAGVSGLAGPTGTAAGTAYINKDASSVKSSIGTIDDEAMAAGSALHAGIPQALMEAAHDPAAAPLLLYAIASAAPQRAQPAATPHSSLTPEQKQQISHLGALVAGAPLQMRIPLSQVLMTTLELLDDHQRQHTLSTLRDVINADGVYTLSECAIYLSAQKYLSPRAARQSQINSISAVKAETLALLQALALASGNAESDRNKALQMAARCLSIELPDTLPPLSANGLSKALGALDRLSPLLKRSLIETAVDMVIADKKLSLAEFELVRCFCDLLDCPVPVAMAAYSQ